jgi:hypothetical protein
MLTRKASLRGTIWGLALAVAPGGCGSEAPRSSDPYAGWCKPLSGMIRIQYVQRSGNCGTIPEQIRDFSQMVPVAGAGACSSSISFTPNRCAADFDTKCPLTDGRFLRENGTVHLTMDGLSATATEQITLLATDGVTVECSGTYDVTYARL